MKFDQRRHSPKQTRSEIPWGMVLSLTVRFCMFFAAAAALLQCLISLYDLALPANLVLRSLLPMTMAISLALSLRRRGLWLLLLTVLYGVFVMKNAEMLLQGGLLLLERALAAMDLVLPDLLRGLMQTAPAAVEQQSLLAALMSIIALLLPLLACCTILGTSAAGLLCCLLPLLPALSAGLVPPFLPIVLLLIVALMLASYRASLHAAETPITEDAELSLAEPAAQQGAWSAAALAVIPLTLLVLLLSVGVLPEATYTRPAYAKNLREAILEMDFAALFDASNDGLSHGDLTALSDIHFTGDTALSVRVSEPRQLYLAGYTAATFTGTSWENPHETDYRRAAEAFQNPLPQNLHARISESAPYTLSVRHADAASDTLYLPNGLATPADGLGVPLLQDGALGGASQPAEHGYTVSALPYIPVPHPLTAAGDLAASYLAAAELAAASAETSVQRSAAAYTAYVTETYTQLPDSTRTAAETLLEDYGLRLIADDGTYDVAALCRKLRDILRTECRYVYMPKSLPAGADFATWFLREAKEGYCVHFATTAAVLLRALGIPTRYAEGYIVIRSDYDKPRDAEGYFPIEDTHAHAWAEVFDPVQLVWVPVEMTPTASDAAQPTATPEAQPTAAPEQTETLQSTAEPQASESPTAEQATPPPTDTQAESALVETTPPPTMEDDSPQAEDIDAQQTSFPQQETEPKKGRALWLRWLMLLLLPLAAAGVHRFRMNRRREKLNHPEPTAAVFAAWRETERLLMYADCPARAIGQSAEDYAAVLGADRPWLNAEQLSNLVRLAERAMFASSRCTPRDREEALHLYAALRTAFLASLPAGKRLLYNLRLP